MSNSLLSENQRHDNRRLGLMVFAFMLALYGLAVIGVIVLN